MSAQDARRVLLQHASPIYPQIARQMRISGVIVFTVTVLPDGHVSALTLRSGHPMLIPAAEAAVRQWRYSSAAEATPMTVHVDFKVVD